MDQTSHPLVVTLEDVAASEIPELYSPGLLYFRCYAMISIDDQSIGGTPAIAGTRNPKWPGKIQFFARSLQSRIDVNIFVQLTYGPPVYHFLCGFSGKLRDLVEDKYQILKYNGSNAGVLTWKLGWISSPPTPKPAIRYHARFAPEPIEIILPPVSDKTDSSDHTLPPRPPPPRPRPARQSTFPRRTSASSSCSTAGMSAVMYSLSISRMEVPMSISDLCHHLESSSLLSSAVIRRIVHRKEITGVKHEFLLLEVHVTSVSRGNHVIWLRLERSAKIRQKGMRFWSFLSEFPSNDTVRVAGSPKLLLEGSQNSEIQAEVQFDPSTNVTLAVLRLLLSCLAEGSPKYNLWKENCWFFCSVVLDLLCEAFPHDMEGKITHKILGKDVRGDIRKQFVERLDLQGF